MIPIKSREELQIMRKGGMITSRVLKEVLSSAEVGVRLSELDKLADKLIIEAGAYPSFRQVEGYNYATCININSGVVHGIPSDRIKIKRGDLVSVDLGAYFQGFHTDSSWTIYVDGDDKVTKKFLEVGKQALNGGIKQCRVGKTIGDIGEAIQSSIETAGFSVVRELIGHGVGKQLHEPPQVPGYGKKGAGPILKDGMVLAVEVIYNRGGGQVANSSDGWTVESLDGSLSGLFEHTVAITEKGPLVLTA